MNSTSGIWVMILASTLPITQVKRVCGQARCRVRNTGTTFKRCADLVKAAGGIVIGTMQIVDRCEACVSLDVPNVSLVDLSFIAKKATSVDEINKALKEASQGAFKGILQYTDGPLVSVDFNGNPMDLLPAVLVTKDNVDDTALWGNQVAK